MNWELGIRNWGLGIGNYELGIMNVVVGDSRLRGNDVGIMNYSCTFVSLVAENYFMLLEIAEVFDADGFPFGNRQGTF